MSRTATTDELCVRCGVNPRRPMAETCAPCRKEITNEYFRERQRKIREATFVVKESPCKCGCGKPVVYPVKYATEECKEIGKRGVKDRNNERRRKLRAAGGDIGTAQPAAKKATDHPERFGLKPHRPEPPPPRKVMSEEEAERLAAAASERDREINNRLVKKSLGLEVRKDCPLASEVVRPPKEVWEQIAANYKPLEQSEREFNLPLRADISYY